MLPWQYIVCGHCLDKNPYAVWLVKCVCFDPQTHDAISRHQPVIVDTESGKLVRTSFLPKGVNVELCENGRRCKKQKFHKCRKAHSKPELECWHAEVEMQQKCRHLLSGLKPVVSSEVCKQCLATNPRAIWLTWLTCTNDKHSEDRVIVVMKGVREKRELVVVREWTERVKMATCQETSSCLKKDKCAFAHSQVELDYWKWRKASRDICEHLTHSSVMCDKYAYPCDGSTIVSERIEIMHPSSDNYRGKYHMLVYLDNLAHAQKMVADCDGPLTIVTATEQYGVLKQGQVHVVGLTNTCMDMAHQKPAHCRVEITIKRGDKEFFVTGEVVDKTEKTLIIKLNGALPPSIQCPLTARFHFEYNSWHFQRLHMALDYAQPELIERLAMHCDAPPAKAPPFVMESITIDDEYQPLVLKKILEGGTGSPFLLLGPFGTGKTHLLLAAVISLVKMSKSMILVCTHHNRGADTMCRKLIKEKNFNKVVLRLCPNVNETRNDLPFQNKSADNVKPEELIGYRVIVTTFMTALKLCEQIGTMSLQFTHIILDEGAQSCEPEALGALLMANKSTQIIVAGDNKQVGPRATVQSEVARDNGLGEPLIERLLKMYEYYHKDSRPLKYLRYSLLTNYRCHPSILMLASSLFYGSTLRSHSESLTHPDAPYPLVFQCSSLQEAFSIQSSNEQEAELVVQRVLEFSQSWPQHNIVVMALSNVQLDCLRSLYHKKRKLAQECSRKPSKVQFSLTYSIQGSECDAVFLSTHEPTDKEGKPLNMVRSICNEYVFNTIITRSRSLVFAVGNPFRLVQMGEYFDINCWAVFIQRCITCQSFHLPQNTMDNLQEVVHSLVEKAFAYQLPEPSSDTAEEEDRSNEGYKRLNRSSRDQRIGEKLVKNPKEIIGSQFWCDSDSEDEDKEVVTGKLQLLSHRRGKIISSDPEISGLTINCAQERRCHFSGQQVRIDKRTKNIIVDLEAVKEVNEKFFGYSFLCRVNPNYMSLFAPFNKTFPLLNNMPKLTTTTTKSEDGVVCFDPRSINTRPRASNFIPKECAVKMVFVVTFLRWRKKFRHPLGIVTGALPCGTSVFTGDMLLRVAHDIPKTQYPDEQSLNDIANTPALTHNREFNSVITIDPEGSKDHDDALSCKSKGKDVYEIGVHITDVQKFVPRGSPLDIAARQRGTSVYSSTSQCVSHMLPEQLVQVASIAPSQSRDAFSVVAQVTIKDDKVTDFRYPSVTASRITSKYELTYQEAYDKFLHGDQSETLTKKLKVLWTVVCHLRAKRIKEAAFLLSVDELDGIMHPEAHVLVEELMIWANRVVANKLGFPVILRSQPAPNEDELKALISAHGHHMSVSPGLRQHIPVDQRVYVAVQMLHETVREMEEDLKNGHVRRALHKVQFEHLQPQVAVAHALFNKIREAASYCAVDTNNDDPDSYSHSSLHCKRYTHFTSPIRRYVDLVIQRLLAAALTNGISPYELKELQDISREAGEKYREADRYEKGMACLDLGLALRQSSREYLFYVSSTEEGELGLTHNDITLKAASKQIKGVHLKHLNATSIPQKESSPEPNEEVQESTDQLKHCTWRVKMSSAQCNPISFLSNPQLEHQPSSSSNQVINMYTGDEPVDRSTVYKRKKLYADIQPFTCSIPAENWGKLQEHVRSQSSDTSPESIGSLLPSVPDKTPNSFPAIPYSLLWVYELHRPLQTCQVLRVQLTGCFNSTKQMVTPAVQLVEVGPNLRVCIQHNSNPTECFTDASLNKAPKSGHTSLKRYFQFWEQALLAEAATASITDAELLMIRDVKVVWPKLKEVTDSQGQVFYQLPAAEDHDRPEESCAYVKLSKSFMLSSYEFFRFSAGDLVCLRYCEGGRSDGVRGVLHMVVSSTTKKKTNEEDEVSEINVYLKFVGERPNYISRSMKAALSNLSYEIQLIPLSLPFRRIYSSLKELRYSSQDVHRIALGLAECDKSAQRIHKVLPSDQASVATTLWSDKPKPAAEPTQLNEYQQKAIELACSQKFVMIKGPPGTGKSVTGAHIAYALAMKLRKEVGKVRKKEGELNPCVMYCGPSQQSVNVVLDILISSADVRDSGLKIVRVYSNAIESQDFQGPKFNPLVFSPIKVDGKCEEKFKQYALHHLVRKKNPKLAELDKKFTDLAEDVIPSYNERDAYRKAVTSTSIEVLKQDVDIVLCTCNEAGSYRITQSVSPTYCIIDECAMATEPECMVAIRRAQHVVLIGDDKQLQPVIQNPAVESMGMGTSLFERYVNRGIEPHMLEIQYRMLEALCTFPSTTFYEGRLQTDPSVQLKYDQLRLLDRLKDFWPQGRDFPLVFCDIIGEEEENHTGHRGSTRVGLESKRNIMEANKIVEMMKTLKGYGVSEEEMAAITPYSAQKEEIKKQLKKENIEGVTVKTITDAQGSEFGIVLLSTVRSLPLEDLPKTREGEKSIDKAWKREHLGFITDRHRICVGITRCKYGLIIVGNKELLAYDYTWGELIKHYSQLHCCVDENFPVPLAT